MHILIAVAAALIAVFAIISVKNSACGFACFLRAFVKRMAAYIMSLSWLAVISSVFIMACYPDISNFLKDAVSANFVYCIKSVVRFVFGVDSAVAALQFIALYSMIASFVSCLILSAGQIIKSVFKAVLKPEGTVFAEDGRRVEDCGRQFMPAFKVFLKFNS